MQVKNAKHGAILKLKEDGNRYIRANVTRTAVPRADNQTVLVNLCSGKLRVISKDHDVFASV